MTDSPLDDVAFLARSDHRVSVLDTLAEGPATRRDLHDETGVSQPTLGRILGAFEARGWVERRGQEYTLSGLGTLVHDGFVELLGGVETVQRLGDVVRHLPTDEMEFDLRAFADATVHRPEPGDTLSHIRRMETVWLAADRRRLLGGTLGPASIEERKADTRRALEEGRKIEVETIVTAEMVAQGMADPEMQRLARDIWDPDRMRSYLYDGPIPLILAVADGVAMLAPTDENGIPTVAVETTNETVRAWVETRLDEYRAQSTPFSPYDLPV